MFKKSTQKLDSLCENAFIMEFRSIRLTIWNLTMQVIFPHINSILKTIIEDSALSFLPEHQAIAKLIF